MVDRSTQQRLRRKFRRSRRQVEGFGEMAEQHFDRHIFRRLNNLPDVRRFIFSWLTLLFLLGGGVAVQARGLSKYYQTNGPVEGGIYTEGILGVFTNANPIYATTSVDGAVSRLLFSGLFTYNPRGELVGDMAEKVHIDDSGRVYTVTLHKGLKWHDGRPLNSEDVVFTYQLIQNPDTKSPLNASWQGIKVEAPDEQTVVFTLPNRLTSFPYSLTNGIVPKHHLDKVPAAQLRSVAFNTLNPVGSGPFKWDAVQVSGGDADDRVEQIVMVPNETYHAGKPKLGRFVIKTYRSEERLQRSFDNQELTAAIGVTKLSKEEAEDTTVNQYDLTLTSAVMIFFKTSDPFLKDANIRKALVHATNQNGVINQIGYPATAVRSPLLKGQVGYSAGVQQLPYDPAAAARLLDEAGWRPGPDGLRFNAEGKPLEISLTSQDNIEYRAVVGALKDQWLAAGIKLHEKFVPESDMQTTIIPLHSYQSLLYGISIGADPDVFAYWHGSQADVTSQGRLNLSEYKSATADEALDGGRTRLDPVLRAAKYKPFLEAWRNDAPAVGLYQPRLLYITRGPVYNFSATQVHSGIDRYVNVQNWMIRQEKVLK